MSFHSPSIWLLLLAPLALLAWPRWVSRRRRATLAWSDVGLLRGAGRGLASWRFALPALRTLAILLVVLGLARPVKPDEQVSTIVEGIAIELVVDRSASMLALDFELDNEQADRLTVLKRVVRAFVGGDETLDGRPDDLIGLVSFAGHADSVCPLTLDHDHLLASLDSVEAALGDGEGGTAIGDGLALGVERLRDASSRVGGDAALRIKSKVVVLLTDGENNAGVLDPQTAAEMASAAGVRVHTIAVGTTGMAQMPVGMQNGRLIYQMRPVSIDEKTLQAIADATGGKAFRATDTEALHRIYAEIDALEKTRSEQRRAVLYKELAVEPARLFGWNTPPLLGVALVVLALEALLAMRLRTLS